MFLSARGRHGLIGSRRQGSNLRAYDSLYRLSYACCSSPWLGRRPAVSTAKEISSNGFRAGRHGVCHVTGAGEIMRSAGPDVHRMHSEPLRASSQTRLRLSSANALFASKKKR